MKMDLVEIDANLLRNFIEAQGLSHSSLAGTLKVTTKTIQRWLNGSVRRLKPETLQSLAKALGVLPERLSRSQVVLSNRPIDRSLEELCSEHFYKRVRASNEWESYSRILKSYLHKDLRSSQQMVLHKHLGQTSLFLGELRSGKSHLDKALEIAHALHNIDEQIFILNWLAIRSELVGNILLAMDYFKKSEELLPKTDNLACVADLYFKKGRVLFHLEHQEESVRLIRESIWLDYKRGSQNQVMISVKYFQLGGNYLRARDLKKAKVAFMRNLRCAEKAGWVRGQAYTYFCLGIIRLLEGDDYSEVRAHVGKAKRLRDNSHFHRLDTKVEQFEFFYCMANDLPEEAKNLLVKRMALVRPSRMHFAFAVLDSMFLGRRYPEHFRIRQTLVEKAKELFIKNGLKEALALLEYLNSVKSISKEDFIKRYRF